MSLHTYLVDSERFAIVHNANFDRVCEVQDGALLNLEDVLYRERNFDAIPFVVRTEDDLLYRPDPLFCTSCAVGFELVLSLVRRDHEGGLFVGLLLTFDYLSRDGIP